MTKKKANKKATSNQVNEPHAEYKAMRFFQSFEEMNEADAYEMSLLSPVQHLQNATAMIKRIFAKDLNSKNDFTIHFK